MHLIIGTSEGVFVGDGADKTISAIGLEGRSVRHLGRPDSDVLAGTAAGVFRSADGGRSWRPSGVEGRFVWDIVAVPGDARRLYAGTEPVGLFKSEDAGRTWTEIESFRRAPGAERWCLPGTPPTAARARTIALDRRDPARLHVGVEVGGVVMSEDAGRTWRCALPAGNPDIHVMLRHPATDALVASTGFGRPPDDPEPREQRIAGMVRSDDGGATWRFLWRGIRPPYTRPLCIDARPPHAVTVGSAPTAFSSVRDPGGAQAVLFQSVDGGETWRDLGDPTHSPSAANFHAVTPDPERVGGVLVGTDTGEVWRVTPDRSWTLLASGLPMVQALLPA